VTRSRTGVGSKRSDKTVAIQGGKSKEKPRKLRGKRDKISHIWKVQGELQTTSGDKAKISGGVGHVDRMGVRSDRGNK